MVFLGDVARFGPAEPPDRLHDVGLRFSHVILRHVQLLEHKRMHVASGWNWSELGKLGEFHCPLLLLCWSFFVVSVVYGVGGDCAVAIIVGVAVTLATSIALQVRSLVVIAVLLRLLAHDAGIPPCR